MKRFTILLGIIVAASASAAAEAQASASSRERKFSSAISEELGLNGRQRKQLSEWLAGNAEAAGRPLPDKLAGFLEGICDAQQRARLRRLIEAGGPLLAETAVDPDESGTYTCGVWKYRLNARGGQRPLRWGHLSYRDAEQQPPRGNEQINRYMLTPWGRMYFVGTWRHNWGTQGWQLEPGSRYPLSGRLTAMTTDEMDRYRAIRRSAEELRVAIVPRGKQPEKPYHVLLLLGEDATAPESKPGPGRHRARIGPEQAQRIVERLATGGTFALAAEVVGKEPPQAAEPRYILEVIAPGRDRTYHLREDLGWSATTLERLQALHEVLEGDAAAAMGKLLERMAPLRLRWQVDEAFSIASPAFEAGKPIPRKHTGEGEDVSPLLRWSNPPVGTRQVALIVDDPDAPRAEPWVHWVLYGIPADARGLPEGVPQAARLGRDMLQGRNSWPRNNTGYRGPMPPPGHGVHHYHFKLYALDKALDLKPGLTKAQLRQAMRGHLLARTQLLGTYERPGR